jgi:hypothetical protein
MQPCSCMGLKPIVVQVHQHHASAAAARSCWQRRIGRISKVHETAHGSCEFVTFLVGLAFYQCGLYVFCAAVDAPAGTCQLVHTLVGAHCM